jgi:hypothetical protein
MTNGGGGHGPKTKKRATGSKVRGEGAKVSARRKNWIPDGIAKTTTRKGRGKS